MSEKIVVPSLGESVTEATVSKWLKSVGEKVGSDEPLVELETDKVNVEVPSPSSGILEKIAVKEGEAVEVGALLGSIGGNIAQVEEKKEKKYKPPLKKADDEIKVFEDETPKDEKKQKNSSKKLVLTEEKEE